MRKNNNGVIFGIKNLKKTIHEKVLRKKLMKIYFLKKCKGKKFLNISKIQLKSLNKNFKKYTKKFVSPTLWKTLEKKKQPYD